MKPSLLRREQMAIVGDARRLRLTYLCWQTAAKSGHALMLIIEASDNLSDFSWTTKQTSCEQQKQSRTQTAAAGPCQQIILTNTFRLWPGLGEVSCHLLSVHFDI